MNQNELSSFKLWKLLVGIIIIPLSIIVLFLVYFIVMQIIAPVRPTPSDASLEKNFSSYETEFNKLISLDQNSPEFKSQLLRLNLKTDGYWKSTPTPYIEFRVMESGSSLSSTEKGYVYTLEPPTPLVTLLDNYDTKTNPHQSIGTVYKNLKGNWYLYYRWDD